MKIEIHGGQLRNKGAQKMLRTVIEKLSQNLNNLELFCDSACGDRDALKGLGLKTFPTSRGWMGGRLFSIKFLMQKILGTMHWKNSINQMDALVDISGFAYSDQWGRKPARDAAKLVRYYQRQNKPVIFLPQAFGPFEDKLLRQYMGEIVSGSNFIYARDKSSLDHLRQIENSDLIKLCPDITFDFANIAESDHTSKERSIKKIALIPNTRVIGSKLFCEPNSYLDTLEAAVKGLTGYEIDVIIHDDSGQDLDLVRKSKVLEACNLIQIDDAVLLKSKINDYRFVIGSRYHGLVAAISQGIPVISIGWSHKYDELMNYCGQQEFNFTEKNSDILEMVKILLDEKKYNQTSEKLSFINDKTARSLRKMWLEVFKLLNG